MVETTKSSLKGSVRPPKRVVERNIARNGRRIDIPQLRVLVHAAAGQLFRQGIGGQGVSRPGIKTALGCGENRFLFVRASLRSFQAEPTGQKVTQGNMTRGVPGMAAGHDPRLESLLGVVRPIDLPDLAGRVEEQICREQRIAVALEDEHRPRRKTAQQAPHLYLAQHALAHRFCPARTC